MYISNGFLIGNILGPLATIPIKCNNIIISNVMQGILAATMIAAACSRSLSLLSWAQWYFVPATVLFSAISGFTNTKVRRLKVAVVSSCVGTVCG